MVIYTKVILFVIKENLGVLWSKNPGVYVIKGESKPLDGIVSTMQSHKSTYFHKRFYTQSPETFPIRDGVPTYFCPSSPSRAEMTKITKWDTGYNIKVGPTKYTPNGWVERFRCLLLHRGAIKVIKWKTFPRELLNSERKRERDEPRENAWGDRTTQKAKGEWNLARALFS